MDFSQLKINLPQNSKPSLMRSISFMWIISGVVLFLVGVWAIIVFFLVTPLRDRLVITLSEYPQNAGFISIINMLPIVGIFLTLVSICSIIAGFYFKQFKQWAYSTIHFLSYLLIFIAGGLGIAWYNLWMFTINNTPSNIWNYVGLFVGIFACIVYVGILIYFIRSIKMKKFRDAYRNKTII